MFKQYGGPGGIRTHDFGLRRPTSWSWLDYGPRGSITLSLFIVLGSCDQQAMSALAVRSFRRSDEESFLELQTEAFRGLEYLPRIKAGMPTLDHEGSFVAERNGRIVGCVGFFKLDRPHWFEIRNLAIKSSEETSTAKKLTNKAIAYAKSKGAEYVKASTPAVEPYVDLYKEAGFDPVRRSLRIAWDLATCEARESRIISKELSKESADDAAKVWVQGLRPYWDYWIEEQGGAEPSKHG